MRIMKKKSKKLKKILENLKRLSEKYPKKIKGYQGEGSLFWHRILLIN